MKIKTSVVVAGALALAAGSVLGWYARVGADSSRPAVLPAPRSNAKSDAARQLWHCGMHPQVIRHEPGLCPICHMPLTPMHSHPDASASTVTIDPSVEQNMGIRTAEVTRGPLTLTIDAAGILEIPDPAIHEISTKTNGWITTLYADTEGMHVHAGEVLFDVYSPELQGAESELIELTRSLAAIKANKAEGILSQAEADVAGARQRLRVRDVADADIDRIAAGEKPPSTTPIRSPASGEIMEKMVVVGSGITAGTKLMRIEGHAQLWLDAQVFQEQIGAMVAGQTVEATFEGVPGKIFTGKVSLVFPHLDHMTHTGIVRTLLDTPDLALKPGMYGQARIITRPVEDAVLVPREAVLDTGRRQVVFVALGNGHFDARQVKVGIVGDDDRVQILDGLLPGELAVTSGQFLLDVESRTVEAVAKLSRVDAPATQSTQPMEMGGSR